MSKETEAIKAVALVAEQAYREVFHVDDTATTTELNVLADAVAALERPTPATEPDRKPPPPNELVNALQDPVHIPRVGRLISSTPIKTKPEPSKASGIGYQINGVPFPPDPTIQPEAKLPDTWEQAVNEAEQWILGNVHEADELKTVRRAFHELRDRLATLQPAVPSVGGFTRVPIENWLDVEALDKGLDETLKHVSANKGWSLDLVKGCIHGDIAASRMGQPSLPAPQSELDKAAADELARIEARCETVPSQPAQPVTVEELANWLKAAWYKHMDAAGTNTWQKMAEAILKAFPTLGSGRLTREEIVERITPIICKREHRICACCKYLYWDCLAEDDPSTSAECKLDHALGSPDCLDWEVAE